ncbi:DUF6390 family protein [Catelliglobosispora koreensis]|uniref:DUF6390 family protein n=1 Tax=Catelliglobosispora koreensis TaxID=129052 RepID=UPI00035D6BB2|nr:DUF6390 family protein [Catelliglobosispora koreensis]
MTGGAVPHAQHRGGGRAAEADIANGALRFARYAYPPNALGYCGPGDSAALLGYAEAGAVDAGLADLAQRFAGAWPYLSLIGAANHDLYPLDDAVVEAYWLGNPLLERIAPPLLAAHLADRFADRAGPAWDNLSVLAHRGGRAHHNFHVFAVYPWVGMLRAGFTEDPLRVLNSCRVRWGTVLGVHPGFAEVWAQPLTWNGNLSLGPGQVDVATLSAAQTTSIKSGDMVSLHWDWVCETLTQQQAQRLQRYTASQLRLVNEALGWPATAALLG